MIYTAFNTFADSKLLLNAETKICFIVSLLHLNVSFHHQMLYTSETALYIQLLYKIIRGESHRDMF